jgi:hypothetical protein
MSELLPFKDNYKNEKVVLFAPAQSYNTFSYDKYKELKLYKKCCVNGSILHKEIIEDLDIYIWAGDLDIPEHSTPSYNPIMDTIPLINKKTLKFVNCWTDGGVTYGGNTYETQLSPNKAQEMGFIRYNQVHEIQIHKDNYFHKDLGGIETGPDGMSVAFHAMQILLYMGFNEIVLVGFDCGGDHSYKDKYEDDVCDWGYGLNHQLINRWKLFKNFVEKEYNNVNIEVVNPIGLKNIFKEYDKITI